MNHIFSGISTVKARQAFTGRTSRASLRSHGGTVTLSNRTSGPLSPTQSHSSKDGPTQAKRPKVESVAPLTIEIPETVVGLDSGGKIFRAA